MWQIESAVSMSMSQRFRPASSEPPTPPSSGLFCPARLVQINKVKYTTTTTKDNNNNNHHHHHLVTSCDITTADSNVDWLRFIMFEAFSLVESFSDVRKGQFRSINLMFFKRNIYESLFDKLITVTFSTNLLTAVSLRSDSV